MLSVMRTLREWFLWSKPRTPDGLDYVAAHARKTWKDLPARDAITNFAGLRASCVEEFS